MHHAIVVSPNTLDLCLIYLIGLALILVPTYFENILSTSIHYLKTINRSPYIFHHQWNMSAHGGEYIYICSWLSLPGTQPIRHRSSCRVLQNQFLMLSYFFRNRNICRFFMSRLDIMTIFKQYLPYYRKRVN